MLDFTNYELLTLTIFGLIFGSFSNMLIYRLPKQLSILPSSCCIHCKHKLGIYDLIPIISYLFSFGKCRYCTKRISLRYPIVEVISVFIWIVNWHFFKYTIDFYFMVFFFTSLLIILYTDMTSFFIPDFLTYPMISLGLIKGYLGLTFMDSIYGTIFGFTIFLIIGIIGKLIFKKNAIGGGDMKLTAGIGSFWGLKTALLSAYFSFMLGGTLGILLVVLKIKKKSDLIPFGPSIIGGFFIALFWGDWIWNTYISG